MLMTDYLNSWIENTNILNYRDFILIQEKAGFVDDDWTDWMEYDFTDGRLWINNDLKKFLTDLFPKNREEVMDFVKVWFENKFEVNVKYVE